MQAVRTATQQMSNNGLPQFGEDIDPARLRAAVETAQAAMPLQEDVEYRLLLGCTRFEEYALPLLEQLGREEAVKKLAYENPARILAY